MPHVTNLFLVGWTEIWMRVQIVRNEFKFIESVESDADPYIVWNPNQEDLNNDCITLSRPTPTGFNRRNCASHKAKNLCEFKSKCIYSSICNIHFYPAVRMSLTRATTMVRFRCIESIEHNIVLFVDQLIGL